ncbi:MAG: nucleoside deaminase [Pirellulales bacterium]|nr:nucleoside deaminase [Pirellulales bacterium]
MFDPNELMRLAIDVCREGIAAGQTPFGCAIAIGDKVVARSHNSVYRTGDITAHAEINAIRTACQVVDDFFLKGAVVATTCEPCPMCMAALHWARVDTVYYGTSIADAKSSGFNELRLSAARLLSLGGSSVQLVGDILVDDCRELFNLWQASSERPPY